MLSNTTVDPFAQTFTLVMADGTPFNVSLADLDGFVSYNLNISIIYASQLGASLVLLVVLALVTKPEKRFVPINILNVLSLALNFVRNILNCLYYTGPFSDIYAYYAQDFSRVPKSAYGNSIAVVVLTVLNLMCVEGSLLLQSQVVCLTLRKVYRQTILAISILISSLAIALRLALCIENSKAIMATAIEDSLTWLVTVANITASISVFWFCIVFVVKLGFAIHQRRKLGLRRFGPMQILFIVGCQTLVIPGKNHTKPSTCNLLLTNIPSNLFDPRVHRRTPRHGLQRAHTGLDIPASLVPVGSILYRRPIATARSPTTNTGTILGQQRLQIQPILQRQIRQGTSYPLNHGRCSHDPFPSSESFQRALSIRHLCGS